MTAYTQRQHLNYTASQLFDLVADVERYPEFMPWVIDVAHPTPQRSHHSGGYDDCAPGRSASGFQPLACCDRPHRIEISSRDPMFDRFEQWWTFEPAAEGGTNIEYHVDFKFRSRMLQLLMGAVFRGPGGCDDVGLQTSGASALRRSIVTAHRCLKSASSINSSRDEEAPLFTRALHADC